MGQHDDDQRGHPARGRPPRLERGPRAVSCVALPIIVLAATAGVWLFYVQHQFEGTTWRAAADWSQPEAALHGSSHYRLPPPLRWFSANIGVHHVHHLSSGIPFYRLPEVLRNHPALGEVGRLSLWESFACVGLALWDEDKGRLVSLCEAPNRVRRAAARSLLRLALKPQPAQQPGDSDGKSGVQSRPRHAPQAISGHSAGVASARPSMAMLTGSSRRRNRRKAIRTSRNSRTQALGLRKCEANSRSVSSGLPIVLVPGLEHRDQFAGLLRSDRHRGAFAHRVDRDTS